MSIKKFSLNNIDFSDNFTLGLFATPGQGKTTLIKKFLDLHKGKYKSIFLFSHSKDNQEAYSDYIDKNHIYNAFDDPLTEFAIQHIQKKQDETKKIYRLLLILDDIVDPLNKLHKSKILPCLLTEYRHFNIDIIISIQYSKLLNPTTRSLIRYVVIYGYNSGSELAAIQDLCYCDMSIKETAQHLNDWYKPHYCLIIDRKHKKEYVYNAKWD